MLLKILLIIAAIWLVFAVLGFLIKGALVLGVIALILFGATSAWAWVKRNA
ncbi:hypothetical protein [Tenggerimyces flavus]|jgi:hypothetical protein|uniref:Uncharacterized protein n=1 Tax=Tenggerimyces flavus TaxID=1708749 RepID=A0ABV7YC52_9ACTN|nr:hypothetical protein [Tenggerimyces flavus]MBM7787179.1 putative membrane-anchored protein [Tenggerimyces flavus]